MKWILGFILTLIAAGVILFLSLPSLLLSYPEAMGWIARIRNPIGPYREVIWAPGPGTPMVPASDRPPNIVVILVDDMGWNDLGWNGGGVAQGSVPTPNIDSLAETGVEFSNGYTGNATCAPSRAAIMTGRYPTRFGFESTPAPPALGKVTADLQNRDLAPGQPTTLFFDENISDIPPFEDQGVPSEELTVAELLKESGYRTLMLGKWHLGSTEGKRPTEQGFDEFLGFEPGGSLFGLDDDPNIVSAKQDFDPIDHFLWKVLSFGVRKDLGARFEPNDYMTDYLSDEAVKAIEANRNHPFFLYLAYNAPHTPLQATRADYDALSHIKHHPTRVYAAMIRALDRGIGNVLKALKDNGLDENTLVFFSSDNGGAHYIGLPEINSPYRGWKMTFFEGGLRTPFFVKWPALLPGGVKIDTPVAHIDVFATAAAAGGATLPTDRVIDGVNLLPFAKGDRKGPIHDALFWRSGGLQVVLADGWKYQVDQRQKKSWLFNLKTDPLEKKNRVGEEPARAKALQELLDAHNQEVGPRHFPAFVEAAVPIDRSLAEPYREGEEWAYWPN